MATSKFSRRGVLGAIGAAPLGVAVAGQTAADAAALPRTELFAVMRLQVGAALKVNPGAYTAPIIGGAVIAGRFQGAVPAGRVDWTRDHDAGVTTVLAQFSIADADGSSVHVRDQVSLAGSVQLSQLGAFATRPELQFGSTDAAMPESAVWVGRLDASGFTQGSVELSIFRVL